jgi:hypothetical protein
MFAMLLHFDFKNVVITDLENYKSCNVRVASTGKMLVPSFAEISRLAQKLRGHTSAHTSVHTHTSACPSDLISLFPFLKKGNQAENWRHIYGETVSMQDTVFHIFLWVEQTRIAFTKH